MESPDPLSSVNRDHEPRRVWSPGFSRWASPQRTGPAKAGTPNKFMGSRDPLSSVNRDHEPRRVWSPGFSRSRAPEGAQPAQAATPNKFMGSHLLLFRMHFSTLFSTLHRRTSSLEMAL